MGIYKTLAGTIIQVRHIERIKPDVTNSTMMKLNIHFISGSILELNYGRRESMDKALSKLEALMNK